MKRKGFLQRKCKIGEETKQSSERFGGREREGGRRGSACAFVNVENEAKVCNNYGQGRGRTKEV